MIRNLTVPACLGAMALPLAATADDYRAQVDLSFDRALFDGDDLPDADVLGIGGTYYFEPVKTDGLPLAEAAFLNRSSFVAAGIARSELGDEKIDIFGAGGGYYLPNTIFYGELNYTYADDFGGDQDRFSAALGVTPIDGLLVTTYFDEDGWDPNARAKYVGKLPNAHFYAASIDVVETDDDDFEFGLGFDYYFDPTFSAGIGLSEHFTILRAEKFFTPSFSLGAHIDIGDDEVGDGFGARVSWRF
jgi:hypothetical protein